MTSVPEIRIRRCNSSPVQRRGAFVLYWMISSRRAAWNFALDRAIDWGDQLRKPVVVLEALRCDYPWASDRLHHFIPDGMRDNALRFENAGILHYPFVELQPGAGKGLLRAMAKHACVVVTDDFPCFFIPPMIAEAARQVPVRMEAIDSNGLLPLRAAPRAFSTAHSFRWFLQKTLPLHLSEFPNPGPGPSRLAARAKIPQRILARWPSSTKLLLDGDRRFLASLPVDHHVAPVAARGGSRAAARVWRQFLNNKLSSCRKDYDKFSSLPGWALETLNRHARDERLPMYSRNQFERAATHDPLWNAAQTQLVRDGFIHNRLRMLWGKKVLKWSRSPRQALGIMLELNNKYALDGRDPNSYSGIFWCLGRYDHPWGPERPILGTVRYMSSTNAARKLEVRDYMRRYQS